MAAGRAASRDAVIDAWICLLTVLAMMVEVNALLSMIAEHTSSRQPIKSKKRAHPNPLISQCSLNFSSSAPSAANSF